MTTRADGVFTGFRRVEADDLDDRAAFLDVATDIPNKVAVWPIPVAEAGVAGQAISFSLRSFAGVDETIAVSGVVSASARLGARRRGVHMSRIVAAIDAVGGREWPSLRALLAELVTLVARLQDLPEAFVRLEASAVAHRLTRVTRRPSPDRFGIFGNARVVDGAAEVAIGLRAGVITACPCTQAFSTYSTALALTDAYGLDHANEIAEQLVTYTHSQRAELSVELEADETVDLADLYQAMNAGAHLVYDLLKRPDEHELVRRAHERPQFTEDVVRAVAAELITRLAERLDPEKTISVACRNIESIHAHDAHSLVEASVGDLSACLSS